MTRCWFLVHSSSINLNLKLNCYIFCNHDQQVLVPKPNQSLTKANIQANSSKTFWKALKNHVVLLLKTLQSRSHKQTTYFDIHFREFVFLILHCYFDEVLYEYRSQPACATVGDFGMICWTALSYIPDAWSNCGHH